MTRTHYDVLGVRPEAGTEEIRAAYLRLAHRYHPDHVGGSDEAMQALNVAWHVLGDPTRRTGYDREIGRPDPRDVFVPDDPFHDDEPDEWVDDTPITAAGQRGPLLTVAPPLLVLAAVCLFAVGVVIDSLAVIGMAGAAVLVAAALFVLVPLTAMGEARRDERR
ncbi:MAG: J domain-containing protein [Actinomycetota bacterium]